MLALSRKKNEAIIVNNNVEITILEVKGDQVKIGVDAPKNLLTSSEPPLPRLFRPPFRDKA